MMIGIDRRGGGFGLRAVPDAGEEERIDARRGVTIGMLLSTAPTRRDGWARAW